jgi:hypothetical protein
MLAFGAVVVRRKSLQSVVRAMCIIMFLMDSGSFQKALQDLNWAEKEVTDRKSKKSKRTRTQKGWNSDNEKTKPMARGREG